MADERITDLTQDTAPALDDWLATVDISDTTMNATGTDKKVNISDLPIRLKCTAITANTTAVSNNGYIINAAGPGTIVVTLPSAPTIGDIVMVTVPSLSTAAAANSKWQIAQPATTLIQFGSTATTAGTGGSLTSTATGDTVVLVYAYNDGTNNNWLVKSSVGNITVI